MLRRWAQMSTWTSSSARLSLAWPGQQIARRNDLLTIYRSRFGSVPRKIRAAVERTGDAAALAKWIEIFVTGSAAEIATAVAKKKA